MINYPNKINSPILASAGRQESILLPTPLADWRTGKFQNYPSGKKPGRTSEHSAGVVLPPGFRSGAAVRPVHASAPQARAALYKSAYGVQRSGLRFSAALSPVWLAGLVRSVRAPPNGSFAANRHIRPRFQ